MDKNLIPGEKNELCYDVRREDPGVYGRIVVSNYRIKFIENGKRENTDEIFDSSSAPFGCIQTLHVPITGSAMLELKIITKDQRTFRLKFGNT